jgi:DNA-binding MarR family transcriptional regulator
MSFLLREYARRELAALRLSMPDDEIRDLVTVTDRQRRRLAALAVVDPDEARLVRAALAYREVMLEELNRERD